LLKTLKENGISYADNFNEAVILTDYAVEARYLIISEPVTEDEYKEAVQMAKLVYNWVEFEIDRQHKLGI